jgi:hypothetical protein
MASHTGTKKGTMMTREYPVPNTTQTRTRSEFCVTDPSSIPDVLRNDGLTEDMFMSIVDWYVSNRIEPEQLMLANFEEDWNSFPHPMIFLHTSGIRFLNEHEVDPVGEWTTVYNIYSSFEEDENKTPFSQFIRKWGLEIKEKCSVDDDEFWFVLEFCCSGGEPRTRHTVNLFEGDWFEYEDAVLRYWSLTDFSIRHLGY